MAPVRLNANVLFIRLLLGVLLAISFVICSATLMAAKADPEWWNRAIFYEVFVRSFADSRINRLANDGIGDIQGLIEHLDYLNDGNPQTHEDLGITGIWLMPIMQSPSYHGYDTTDYYDVQRDYGTRGDFRRLIKEAHKRGIRVIIDLVINHVSREHPWFEEGINADSVYHDWFLWSDKDPGYQGPWGQQVWHEIGGQYYYGIFWEGMPDLNFRNPEVNKQIYSIIRFWVEEMEVDGFRLDAIRHLFEDGPIQVDVGKTHNWLRRFHTFVKTLDKDNLSVGEIWADTETISTYTSDKLDLAFQFGFAKAILESVASESSDPLTKQGALIAQKFRSNQYATFITNHDQERVMTYLGGETDKAKLAASILLTSPGVPFIYYGEEIGMTGMKPDPKIRTPMQWSDEANAGFSVQPSWQAVNADYKFINVRIQSRDPTSLLNHYRRLIHLRNTHPALQYGAYSQALATNKQVYAFLRILPDETILLLFNLGRTPVKEYSLNLKLPPGYQKTRTKELLKGVGVAPLFPKMEGHISAYKPFERLEPRTGYVIRISPQ